MACESSKKFEQFNPDIQCITQLQNVFEKHPICTKSLDRQSWTNIVDEDQTPRNAASDQDLHCLPLARKI